MIVPAERLDESTRDAVADALPAAVHAPLWPLAALLAASGAAALTFELVWFQLLALVIGASAPSLGVLLATFMGGLGAGSVLFARLVSPRRAPLAVYAGLEAAIGVAGIAVLAGLPALADAYAAAAGTGFAGLASRAAVAALCLLPPTLLMGATLPAAARALAPRHGRAAIGWLYAANTAGAVIGAVVAGFYLLRVHDTVVATLAAAALNAASAAGAWALARRRAAASLVAPTAIRAPVAPIPMRAPAVPPRSAGVLAAIALSGFAALGAQVVWTRQLALLIGGTVYTFASILALFLLALGVGAAAGTAVARRVDARAALGACQLAACAALAWGAHVAGAWLPYWPIDVMLITSAAVQAQLDLVRVALVVLPAAFAWGASVPLALAAVVRDSADPAPPVGRVYAANTAGAIAGALATTFVLMVWLGSAATQRVLIAASACAALLALWPATAPARAIARRLALAGGVAVAALAAAIAVPPLPGKLVAYGRFMPTRAVDAEVLYVGEGLTASVAVTQEPNGQRTYHSAGKAQASTYVQDMRLQRMLGHLATLVADEPRSVLVIGLGAGITAGAVAIDPAVERVVVAEIEARVADQVTAFFAAQSFDVARNPKVQRVVDDGRHYLATTAERFDAITSDPLDPWVKGAAALYTVEFWRLVKTRLNPGGVVTVFVQLYETTEDAVRSELATFFEVFPNGALFANTVDGMGYDAVLLGRADGAPIDVDALHAKLAAPRYAQVAASLREVGFDSATDLLGAYAGGAADMRDWLQGAALNRDRNLRLQYLAGVGLNRYAADEIFRALRPGPPAFPAELFSGSPPRLAALRHAIGSPP